MIGIRRMLMAALFLSIAATGLAGSRNDANVSARFLVGDGSWELDTLDSSYPQAWFSVPVYAHHSYSMELYVPGNYVDDALSKISLDLDTFEVDGTTSVATSDQRFDPPNLDENLVAGGGRRTLYNAGTDRFVRLKVRLVTGSSPVVGTPISFRLRVVDLTQVAARFTVNGYNMLVAVTNSSSVQTTARIEYFSEAGGVLTFDAIIIPAHGSVQVSHAANVPIAGALFGGIWLVPTKATPGALTAQEYNFNAAVGNYLTFPFHATPWVTATPQQ